MLVGIARPSIPIRPGLGLSWVWYPLLAGFIVFEGSHGILMGDFMHGVAYVRVGAML